MRAMRDLTDNGVRLEIQEMRIQEITILALQDGRHSAGTAGRYRTCMIRAWDSERIAIRPICGEGHGSLRSHHFLPAARYRISEDLVSADPTSAARASAVTIL